MDEQYSIEPKGPTVVTLPDPSEWAAGTTISVNGKRYMCTADRIDGKIVHRWVAL